MSAPIPDFRDLIAGLDRFAGQWEEESTRLSQALAASAVEVTRPEFTLTVTQGRITALRFTEQGRRLGPVQLRERLLSAYAEAAAAGTVAASAAVGGVLDDPELAAGIRTSLPESVRPDDEAAPDSVSGRARTEGPGGSDRRVESLEDWLADPALDDAQVSADLDRTMADVDGWEQYRDLGDPSMWQYDLEQTVARLSSRAGELREQLDRITAQAESPALTVEVNAGGGLVDLRLRPGADGLSAERLSEEFATLYHQAATEAGARTTEALRTGGVADDDPSLAVFGPQDPPVTAGRDDPAGR